MKQKTLSALSIVILLSALLLAAFPFGDTAAADGPHIVPLRPGLVEQLKAKGQPNPELRFDRGSRHGRRFATPEGVPLGTLTVPDSLKALVLLVEFTDTDPAYGQPVFEDMILGTFFDPPGNEVTLADGTVVHGPTDRTLQNYLDEVSYGMVGVHGTVLNWVQVDHPYEYYCNATWPNWWGFGAYPSNVQGLVEDAVRAADPHLDFSQFDTVDPYDRDGDGDFFEPDGWVDNLFVVHTGSGAEWTTQIDVIWSHSWDMSVDDWGNPIPPVVVDGVQIMDYSMEPEYGGYPDGPNGTVSEPYPPTVGVYAHEFLHVLGLPDEYDYGYESMGTADWSGMAVGSWNFYPDLPWIYGDRFSGNSPSHPSAWGKVRLGFVTPIQVPLEGLEDQVLPPVEEQPVVFRLDVPFAGGTEYFLAENRQLIGFDAGLAGYMDANAHGLLVYHVDENVFAATYWRPNDAECWRMNNANCTKVNPANGQTHYGISVEQADGLFELEKGKDYADTSDPFPGIRGVGRFTATTTPNSSSFYFWSGPSPVPGRSAVRIENIQEADGTITADFGYDAQGNW